MVFNGESVSFIYLGAQFSSCGGRYESVEVPCPKCGGFISFTKEELEKESA